MDIFYKRRILPTALLLVIALVIALIQARVSYKSFNDEKPVNSVEPSAENQQWTEKKRDASFVRKIFDDCLNLTLILCLERLQKLHQEMR
jgi:hypothetical protein